MKDSLRAQGYKCELRQQEERRKVHAKNAERWSASCPWPIEAVALSMTIGFNPWQLAAILP
jgi:hypothetical protein